MQTIEVKAAKRDNLGKSATKELRASEKVPAVLYGGEEVVHFYAEANEFRKLLYTPNVYLIHLNVDSKTYTAVIKDTQFHPVSDELIHIDFLQVSEDKPIVIEIPVKLEGLAENVKAGGKLTLEQRKLRVKGLMKDLPDHLTGQVVGQVFYQALNAQFALLQGEFTTGLNTFGQTFQFNGDVNYYRLVFRYLQKVDVNELVAYRVKLGVLNYRSKGFAVDVQVNQVHIGGVQQLTKLVGFGIEMYNFLSSVQYGGYFFAGAQLLGCGFSQVIPFGRFNFNSLHVYKISLCYSKLSADVKA